MDFIVLETKKENRNRLFISLYVINVDNLLELRQYIKENFDLDYDYIIYTGDGLFVEFF